MFLLGYISPGTLVSSTNKTDGHDITEILLKVALNALTVTVYISFAIFMFQALAGSCAGHIDSILKISIFCNSSISFKNKPLVFTSFLQSNLRTINDI
jgi:hypothetical protein